MAKFEYCNLTIAFSTNKIAIFFPNGDTKSTTDKNLIDVMNDLGQEDWELVSVTYLNKMADKMAGVFYFKRELKTISS